MTIEDLKPTSFPPPLLRYKCKWSDGSKRPNVTVKEYFVTVLRQHRSDKQSRSAFFYERKYKSNLVASSPWHNQRSRLYHHIWHHQTPNPISLSLIRILLFPSQPHHPNIKAEHLDFNHLAVFVPPQSTNDMAVNWETPKWIN